MAKSFSKHAEGNQGQKGLKPTSQPFFNLSSVANAMQQIQIMENVTGGHVAMVLRKISQLGPEDHGDAMRWVDLLGVMAEKTLVMNDHHQMLFFLSMIPSDRNFKLRLGLEERQSFDEALENSLVRLIERLPKEVGGSASINALGRDGRGAQSQQRDDVWKVFVHMVRLKKERVAKTVLSLFDLSAGLVDWAKSTMPKGPSKNKKGMPLDWQNWLNRDDHLRIDQFLSLHLSARQIRAARDRCQQMELDPLEVMGALPHLKSLMSRIDLMLAVSQTQNGDEERGGDASSGKCESGEARENGRRKM